jgi:hypothetical protein
MIRVYDLVRTTGTTGTTEEIYELTLEGAEYDSEDHWADHISCDLDGRILSHSDEPEDQEKNAEMIDRLSGRIHCIGSGRIEVIEYQSWGGVEYRPVVIFDVQ